MVKKDNLPITKIVDDIMEQKQGKFNDEYKYLDPKILRGNESGQIPRTKTPFSDAIVFVVGGGNYIEYQNLQDYVKTKNVGYTNSVSKYEMKKIKIVHHIINFSEPRIIETCCVRVHAADQLGPVPQPTHHVGEGNHGGELDGDYYFDSRVKFCIYYVKE